MKTIQPSAAHPAERGVLSPHVEDAVDALANIHQQHYSEASPLQRAIDWVVDVLGRPHFGALLVTVVIACAGAIYGRYGAEGAHSAGFAWLEFLCAIAALLVAVLIFVAQRRENLLAERREQLTLELALLAERKTAKIISLLEELRRDTPTIANRIDTEGEEMAKPADPDSVLAALDKRTARLPPEQEGGAPEQEVAEPKGDAL